MTGHLISSRTNDNSIKFELMTAPQIQLMQRSRPKGPQAHIHSLADGTTRDATTHRDSSRQG